MRAVVVRPGEGERVGNVEFLARTDDTPRFNLAVIRMRPGAPGPGAHVNPDEDDSFYVLSGSLRFEVEGEIVDAGPGTFVLVPPGVEHSFSNPHEEPAEVLNVHAPAGFDRRLRE